MVWNLSKEWPRIALMMIVKNESKALPSLLSSVKDFISSWVIIDTGSTDSTQEIIKEHLQGIPGEIVERPWVNFGHNRTELMGLFPEDCEYAFLLDADHILTIPVPEFDDSGNLVIDIPDADCFMLQLHERPIAYRMPYFVRKRNDYFFKGVTHEYLTAKGPLVWADFDYFHITHTDKGGAKADKFERDLALLTSELENDPSGRTYFYLGQTYWCMNKFDEAIKHYLLCAETTSWDEEKYFALLRAGRVSMQIGQQEKALVSFLRASDAYPSRAEASYEIGKIYAALGMKSRALKEFEEALRRCPQQGRLMVEHDLGKWGIEIEIGVLKWWLGNKEEAKLIFEDILRRPNLPQVAIDLLEKNLKFC